VTTRLESVEHGAIQKKQGAWSWELIANELGARSQIGERRSWESVRFRCRYELLSCSVLLAPCFSRFESAAESQDHSALFFEFQQERLYFLLVKVTVL
jgi:hypothetical protein